MPLEYVQSRSDQSKMPFWPLPASWSIPIQKQQIKYCVKIYIVHSVIKTVPVSVPVTAVPAVVSMVCTVVDHDIGDLEAESSLAEAVPAKSSSSLYTTWEIMACKQLPVPYKNYAQHKCSVHLLLGMAACFNWFIFETGVTVCFELIPMPNRYIVRYYVFCTIWLKLSLTLR